jgi:hypothetical protein
MAGAGHAGEGTGGADAGSGGSAAPPPPSGAVTYHKDVRALIEKHCLECHVAGGVGPFTLDGFAAVNAVAAGVVPVVSSGYMPPWPADGSCNPLIDDRSLSQAEKDVFTAWQTDGYLEGDPNDYVKPPPRDVIVPTGAPSLMLAPKGSFTPAANADEYRCFFVGTVEADTYFSGMAIRPGVAAEVHHAQIHRVNAAQVATLEQAEAADPEPGYACSEAFGVQAQIMFSYRPGSLGVSFPEGDAGLLPAGSGLLVQVHYNTVFLPEGSAPEPDATSIAFWTLPEGQLPERIVYRTTVWGPSNLPAGNEHVVTTTLTPMRNLSSFTAGAPLGMSAPFGAMDGVGAPSPAATATFVPGELVGITPHAHQLATRMSASLQHADASPETCLVDVPRWDFHWQLDYLLQQGVAYGPDDMLSATCEWDNGADNQPIIDGVKQAPRDVTFGERSIDEMCQHWIWLRFDREAFESATQ